MTHKKHLFILLSLWITLTACTPAAPNSAVVEDISGTMAAALEVEPSLTPTTLPSPTITQAPPTETLLPKGHILYQVQAGDTLSTIAYHFGVPTSQIFAPGKRFSYTQYNQLLEPGTQLLVPDAIIEETTTSKWLLPDSEVVYTASAADFDPISYVNKKGGYLSAYTESVWSGDPPSGAFIVQHVARQNSINPKLLLAILEYRCGCVRGKLKLNIEPSFMAKVGDARHVGLYRQMAWIVERLNEGYYGWREGRITHLTFVDGEQLRLAPDLNAGTVALMHLMSQIYDREGWEQAIDAADGFPAEYRQMFPGMWGRAEAVEPLYTSELTQPDMVLPYLPGHTWSYTGGPHSAWGKNGAEAAIDFNPGGYENTCESDSWVVAMADGLVIRLEEGVLIQDLDMDGDEQTGWVIVYVHLKTMPGIHVYDGLTAGQILGNPSCLGGPTDSAHIHIARKYNGEWMPAGGPVPLEMDGWVVGDLDGFYKGTISKDGVTLTSCTCATWDTLITRPKEE